MDETTTYLPMAVGALMFLVARGHGAVVRRYRRYCPSCGLRLTLGVRCRCRQRR